MAVAESKGAIRLDEEAMKSWTDKFSEAEKQRQKQQEEIERESSQGAVRSAQ
jgi:hypothetical protein